MRVKGSCLSSIHVLAAVAALAVPTFTFADRANVGDSTVLASASNLSLTPTLAPDALALATDDKANLEDSSTNKNYANSPSIGQTKQQSNVVEPAAQQVAEAPETPNIHGFFNSPFKTGYLTPRGLYVQNSGISWQPVVGLVFPLGDFGPVKKVAFVGGIWNAVDTYESKFNKTTGAWDEMDVFASFNGTVSDVVSLNLTYGAWNSPEHAFSTEHNLDLKIGYSDAKMWGDTGFSLNPYVDLWWAIAGDSTVILGRRGGTGYIEPGIVPTYTYKGITSYPITFTAPTYVSVGPSSYWDRAHTYSHSNFGVFSTGLSASVPLSFIPARYGYWHGDAGVTYDYLINESLLHAGTLASGNTNHNCLLGSIGFGVNF